MLRLLLISAYGAQAIIWRPKHVTTQGTIWSRSRSSGYISQQSRKNRGENVTFKLLIASERRDVYPT